MRPLLFAILAALATLIPTSNARAATLAGAFTPLLPGTVIDLTAEGTADWVHWGFDPAHPIDRNVNAMQQISTFTLIGTAAAQPEAASLIGYTWSDGTPTAGVTNTTTSISVTGLLNGFQISVPADTSLRELKVYVGAYSTQARFAAVLSDSSAPPFVDFALDDEFENTNGVYTLSYAAASAGQELTVSYTINAMHDVELGSAFLQAASLVFIGTNKPPSVALTSPAPESNFLLSSSITITVDAFDVDGSIREVEFYDGSAKLGGTTNSPYTFVWTTAAAGFHQLNAVARDDSGATTRSRSVEIFVVAPGGVLSGLGVPPGDVNLTAEGTSDWAHWGLITENSFDHKAGVTPQISNYALLGTEPAYPYADNSNSYTWTDGTPTLSALQTITGVYVVGIDNGFEITAPADTTLKTLKVYVGTYGARGKLRAFLSDFTAPLYTDTNIDNVGNGPGGVYALHYQAASPEQTLTARFTVLDMHDRSYGNVTLQAATLVSDNLPPIAAITTPANKAVFRAPANITIQANASDPDGSIQKLELFNGPTKLGGATTSQYSLIWSNVPLGAYSLTAKATDNRGATFVSPPVNVYVTLGGGILVGSVTNPQPLINLTTEGQWSWTHCGLRTRNSFDQKANPVQAIPSPVLIGANSLRRYADNASGFTWTDGTPTLSANSTTTGIFVYGSSNGFQLSLPADRTIKRLKLYVGLFGATSTMEAGLSDFSAAPYVDSTLSSVFGNAYGVYTIHYAAASAGQTLKIRYTASGLYDPVYGNVTWQSATLADGAPVIRAAQCSPGNHFTFVVTSEPGLIYRCQFTDSLKVLNWQRLTEFTGNGADIDVRDDTGVLLPERYYRVRLDF